MFRRSFDKAFKTAAVKLIIEESFSANEVSAQLDVHVNSLYRWVQEVENYGDSAFPGKGSALFDAHYEIKKLEQENRYLREELELVKHSMFQNLVFMNFSKENRQKENEKINCLKRRFQRFFMSIMNDMEPFELRKS